MKNKRMVEEIDITIRYNGNDSVHELYFDKDDKDLALSEEEMYEYGFTGDIDLEDENGDEILLSLDASNPEYFDGTLIAGIVYNIYPLNQPEESFDGAQVVGVKVSFYDED